MNRRVVVTGLGAITPIGNNVPEFWSAVKQQKVGIGEITHFDATDYKCHLAAEVKDFDAKEYMDFRSAKRMEAFCQFAVAAAGELCKEAGAKRVVPLKVSGPFHSAMLKGAGEKLGEELKHVTVHTPAIPYVANVTADYVTKEEEIKPLLEKQVSSSVRWQQTIERLIADGADKFVEIGPGKTLTGFMRKINRDVAAVNIDKYEDFEKFVAESKNK